MSTNLTSIKVIKNLFKEYQIYPSKKFGQNFLISQLGLQKMIKSANLSSKDIVLEIGPGIGTLTVELVKRVKKVIAIEKDPKLIEILKETLKGFQNIEIVGGDILELEIWKLFKNLKLKIKNFKVVANLPFYLTAPLLRKFLEIREARPPQMVLIIQKEVAQRICSKPPDMNLLAVSVQFYAKPEIISCISKKSFWPQPKVDSAIIKIVPRQFCVQISPQFRERFFRIVRAGFSQPRKQIINNLTNKLKLNKKEVEKWLLKNNIQPSQRAETLSLEDWLLLTKSF